MGKLDKSDDLPFGSTGANPIVYSGTTNFVAALLSRPLSFLLLLRQVLFGCLADAEGMPAPEAIFRPVVPGEAVATLVLIENSQAMVQNWSDLRDHHLPTLLGTMRLANPIVPVSRHGVDY